MKSVYLLLALLVFVHYALCVKKDSSVYFSDETIERNDNNGDSVSHTTLAVEGKIPIKKQDPPPPPRPKPRPPPPRFPPCYPRC